MISIENFTGKSKSPMYTPLGLFFYFIGQIIDKDIAIRIRLLYKAHADTVF